MDILKTVEFSGVTLKWDVTTDRLAVDIGGIYLERDGRKFNLDTPTTYCNPNETPLCITADVEVDTDWFPEGNEDEFEECPYDLTEEDLLSPDLVANIFVSHEILPIKMYLTVFIHKKGEKPEEKRIKLGFD